MTPNALPAAQAVRAAAEKLLAAHRGGGSYPTVSGLARQFGVNRTTFYRHYPDIVTAMLDAAAKSNAERPRRRRAQPDDDETEQALQRLRRENTDLRKHVEVYEAHIRMLTMENQRLREQIETTTGVTRLSERRRHDD